MAKKCDSAINPSSLNWCEGDTNTPGIRSRLWYIPKKQIQVWPTLPKTLAVGESMGKLAVYKGDYVLAADAVFLHMDIIINRSPVTSESQGNKPSKTFLNQGTFVVPQTDEEAAGFSRLANNGDYVYLIQETSGKIRVLGNEMYQTETTVGLALGSSATEDMGTTINVQVTDICHAPFYEGQIVTEDGIINETDSGE